MKTIQAIFSLTALLLTIWQCTTPEPKARLWQSYIPEGYTLRDSVRGDLNLDSIPDFLLVLDSITPLGEAPQRPVLLLYGLDNGKFELAEKTNTLVYDIQSGGVKSSDPYEKAYIRRGRFTIFHRGGMPGLEWNYEVQFAIDSVSKVWYLNRTSFTTINPKDTLPVIENVQVKDTRDFGSIRLQDFDIYKFEAYQEDTIDRDDRFISYNFFKMNQLKLPANSGQFDSIAALKALYPGRFLRDYDGEEDVNVLFWICEKCPEVQLQRLDDLFDEETYQVGFPYEKSNFTHVIKTIGYNEKGVRHIAVFFSTSPQIPGNGRTEPGILGMAIFEKSGDFWVLKAFSPHVAAEGTFMRAHPPEKAILAVNQTFFELNGGNANAAGSWVNYYDKYIFGIRNGVPEMLFYEPAGTCQVYDSLMTHWRTTVMTVEHKKHFPDLKMTTTGHFEKSSDEAYVWDKLPWLKKQIQQHPGQDSFDFKVERRFRFNGKKYVPVR